MFRFTKQLKAFLDSAQARMVRRIAKIPASFIKLNRISLLECGNSVKYCFNGDGWGTYFADPRMIH